MEEKKFNSDYEKNYFNLCAKYHDELSKIVYREENLAKESMRLISLNRDFYQSFLKNKIIPKINSDLEIISESIPENYKYLAHIFTDIFEPLSDNIIIDHVFYKSTFDTLRFTSDLKKDPKTLPYYMNYPKDFIQIANVYIDKEKIKLENNLEKISLTNSLKFIEKISDNKYYGIILII